MLRQCVTIESSPRHLQRPADTPIEKNFFFSKRSKANHHQLSSTPSQCDLSPAGRTSLPSSQARSLEIVHSLPQVRRACFQRYSHQNSGANSVLRMTFESQWNQSYYNFNEHITVTQQSLLNPALTSTLDMPQAYEYFRNSKCKGSN